MKELTTTQVSTVISDPDSVDAAILSRFSTRAYLNKPVGKAVLEDLLQVAARSPSGNQHATLESVCAAGHRQRQIGERSL
jgi:nitroreductase